MTLLPRDVNKVFAFQMVISPTDSYTLPVANKVQHVPRLLLSALKPYMMKSLDVMLHCIMSH